MLAKLLTCMNQGISFMEVHMSFPSTLVTHGCGTVSVLVVVHMEVSVILTLIQV